MNHFNTNYTTYKSDGISVEDEVVLKIGENYLENSGEIVNLTKIYTRFNKLCFAINTTRNIDEKETEIKIWSLTHLLVVDVFFTSEKNSYGITRRDWRDGEVYSFSIKSGTKKDISFTFEKNINLKCSEESFYEHVASKLSNDSFEGCSNTCLMTSLPTDLFLAALGVALNQILFPFYGFEVGGFMRPCTVHKQTDFSENTTNT